MVERTTFSVPEVIALEQKIAAAGTPLIKLMEHAGHAVSQAIFSHSKTPCEAVIFCGSGNNGGDGWVVASDLVREGYEVVLITPVPAKELRSEPARTKALEVIAECETSNIPLEIIVSPSKEIVREKIQQAEALVDALLGTGFSGKQVKEPFAGWIECMNEHKMRFPKSFLISIDTPSGFSAQEGTAATPCVVADKTITMLVNKPGLLSDEAKRYCGELELAPLIDIQKYLPL